LISKLISFDNSGTDVVAKRWAEIMSGPNYTHSVAGVRLNDGWQMSHAKEILQIIVAIKGVRNRFTSCGSAAVVRGWEDSPGGGRGRPVRRKKCQAHESGPAGRTMAVRKPLPLGPQFCRGPETPHFVARATTGELIDHVSQAAPEAELAAIRNRVARGRPSGSAE
jgi:hypothetical protein